jgi:hypothetical protein
VQEQQRQGVLGAGTDVEEVDVLPVDLGDELRVLVVLGLGRPPVGVSSQWRAP